MMTTNDRRRYDARGSFEEEQQTLLCHKYENDGKHKEVADTLWTETGDAGTYTIVASSSPGRNNTAAEVSTGTAEEGYYNFAIVWKEIQ